MKLLNIETQKKFEAVILDITDEDYEKISKSRQFQFDWTQEKGNHVFKIVKETDEAEQEVLGLLSITNIPDEFRVHVNLVECSDDNKGKKKKIDRIAGCLLSYAVQIAFEHGYAGFTSLTPKTELIDLYTEKYGFSQYGRQLAIEGKEAIKLIQKYL